MLVSKTASCCGSLDVKLKICKRHEKLLPCRSSDNEKFVSVLPSLHKCRATLRQEKCVPASEVQ